MAGTFLSSWPWENMGSFKVSFFTLLSVLVCIYDKWPNVIIIIFGSFCKIQYALYGPMVAKAVEAVRAGRMIESWWIHLFVLFVLRGLVHQLWFSYSNMLFFTRQRRVIKDGVEFKQIDNEWGW
jgi:hypothetical protein